MSRAVTNGGKFEAGHSVICQSLADPIEWELLLLLFSYAAVPLVRARRSLSSYYTGKTLPVSRVKKPVTTLKNHKIRVQNTTKEKGKEWLG